MIRQVKITMTPPAKVPHLGNRHPQADRRERPRRATRVPQLPVGQGALIVRSAGHRAQIVDSTTAPAKHTLPAIERRWLELEAQIEAHDAVLDDLNAPASPTLRYANCLGPVCAAEILIVAADNPELFRHPRG